MAERILALDPGGTSGWALWQERPLPEHSALPTSLGPHFTVGQLGPEEHHRKLSDLLGLLQMTTFTVVCESFEFRQHDDYRTGVDLSAKEYIGVVKLFAQERMNTRGQKLVFQTPAQAKGFVPDKAKEGLAANAKLKAMELWVPEQRHAMDAMRHLITYMVTKRGRLDLIESWKTLA